MAQGSCKALRFDGVQPVTCCSALGSPPKGLGGVYPPKGFGPVRPSTQLVGSHAKLLVPFIYSDFVQFYLIFTLFGN